MRHRRRSEGDTGSNVTPSPPNPGQELRRLVAPVPPSQSTRILSARWITRYFIYGLSGGKISVCDENTLESLSTTWIAYFDSLCRDAHLFRRENFVVTYQIKNHISQLQTMAR